jgi:hypothetical protein
MSYEGLLNRDCLIYAPVYGSKDSYNQPVVTYPTGVPTRCRIEPSSGREMKMANPKTIAEYVVFLPAGTAISEKSVLTVSGVGYNILLVRPFDGASDAHHIECFAEKIR